MRCSLPNKTMYISFKKGKFVYLIYWFFLKVPEIAARVCLKYVDLKWLTISSFELIPSQMKTISLVPNVFAKQRFGIMVNFYILYLSLRLALLIPVFFVKFEANQKSSKIAKHTDWYPTLRRTNELIFYCINTLRKTDFSEKIIWLCTKSLLCNFLCRRWFEDQSLWRFYVTLPIVGLFFDTVF